MAGLEVEKLLPGLLEGQTIREQIETVGGVVRTLNAAKKIINLKDPAVRSAFEADAIAVNTLSRHVNLQAGHPVEFGFLGMLVGLPE